MPISGTDADEQFRPLVNAYAHNLFVGSDFRKLESRHMRAIDHVDIITDMGIAALPAAERAEVEADPCEFRGAKRAGGLRRYLRTVGSRPRQPPPAIEPLRHNLVELARLLGLEPLEAEMLQFLFVVRQSRELKELVEAFGDVTLPMAATVTALALARPVEQVRPLLAKERRLRGSGLVSVEERDGYNYLGKLEVMPGLMDLVLSSEVTRDTLLGRFMPETAPASLEWDDFSHLREKATLARDLLRGALDRGERGVNVLLYGVTGTGKTELARLIAKDLGVKLYVVGRSDQSGESAQALERLRSLLFGNCLVAKARALLLFDELEDLFEWDGFGFGGGELRGTAQMSKQWFNDVLERNPTPTLWITNRVRGIDRAFLRRFKYAIEFRELGPTQRARVLSRHLGEESAVSPAEVESIAERYEVSPAQLASAVGAARLLRPDGRPDLVTLERVLAPVHKLVTGSDALQRQVFDARTYRIDALNCRDDLAAVADRLAGWQPALGLGVSLCLYGPPGTGKTEYCRYLAHRMGRRVVYRRVSDLQSPWLGVCEANIAAAFREAEEEDALLLFDEADTWLRDRRDAVRSWEVSQTNEFLAQLESCRSVVACTTNLWRDLDPACVRRFIFKLEFSFMRPEQSAALFASMFTDLLAAPLTDAGTARVHAEVARLNTLTPGDFAAVARRVRALGQRLPAAELVTLLRHEVEAKTVEARRVGF